MLFDRATGCLVLSKRLCRPGVYNPKLDAPNGVPRLIDLAHLAPNGPHRLVESGRTPLFSCENEEDSPNEVSRLAPNDLPRDATHPVWRGRQAQIAAGRSWRAQMAAGKWRGRRGSAVSAGRRMVCLSQELVERDEPRLKSLGDVLHVIAWSQPILHLATVLL